MRSVRMPAAFLPCSDGSPEWIPHGGPLLQRLTVTCRTLYSMSSDEAFQSSDVYLKTREIIPGRPHRWYKTNDVQLI